MPTQDPEKRLRPLPLLLLALSVPACGGSAPAPAPPPAAISLPAPATPPPSEPEGLAVVSAPPSVCELTRPLEPGPIELAVLPKADAFGQVAAGVVRVGFGPPGAFAEVRTAGWSLRGVPSEEATRVSAARWLSFGGVLYASKRDRFAVEGTRNGKLLLPAPGAAGFTPSQGSSLRETSCEEVSLVADPDGALGRDVPPAFLPAKAAQPMVLRRTNPVPISAEVDGAPGGTIDADDTDVEITLLERRGNRARVRMGHVAGWVDGALVRPQPKKHSRAALEAAAQFGMIGLLSTNDPGDEATGAAASGSSPPATAPSDATATAGSVVACASDVRLVVDWTTSGSIAASAGATASARRYVVGVVPAGKPVRIVERGPELATVSLGGGVFLPRGYARLTVPSRDLASGCAFVAAPAEPAATPSEALQHAMASAVARARTGDSVDSGDAIDRLEAPEGDEIATRGNMWGDAIGQSFGAGGLGLSGVGTGQGTGVGTGRLGHSTKAAPGLREGATQVTGRLPPEIIQRIVRQNFGRFRLCYENGLKKNPTLSGRVSVKFVIDVKGAVSRVSNAGSDFPSPETLSCIMRRFSSLSFPQPDGGPVTVVYPIIFSPG